MNAILVIGFLVISLIALYWLEHKLDSKKEDTTHHDNKPGSYYYEASKILRDKREESYGRK